MVIKLPFEPLQLRRRVQVVLQLNRNLVAEGDVDPHSSMGKFLAGWSTREAGGELLEETVAIASVAPTASVMVSRKILRHVRVREERRRTRSLPSALPLKSGRND